MLAATAACVLAGVVRAEAEAGHMMMMDKVCSLTHFFLVLNYLHTEESSNPSGVKSLGSAQELGGFKYQQVLLTTSDRIFTSTYRIFISTYVLQHAPREVEGL